MVNKVTRMALLAMRSPPQSARCKYFSNKKFKIKFSNEINRSQLDVSIS